MWENRVERWEWVSCWSSSAASRQCLVREADLDFLPCFPRPWPRPGPGECLHAVIAHVTISRSQGVSSVQHTYEIYPLHSAVTAITRGRWCLKDVYLSTKLEFCFYASVRTINLHLGWLMKGFTKGKKIRNCIFHRDSNSRTLQFKVMTLTNTPRRNPNSLGEIILIIQNGIKLDLNVKVVIL